MTQEQSYRIKELTHLSEMLLLYPLLQQSYSHISFETYASLLPEMIANGYKQVGVFVGESCLGFSGFWVNTKVYCGRYIEMDNVVVDAVHRSAGIGKLLADWIVEKGQALGCVTALLDVAGDNSDAQRFWVREGYVALGYHMHRPLNPPNIQKPTLFEIVAMTHRALVLKLE